MALDSDLRRADARAATRRRPLRRSPALILAGLVGIGLLAAPAAFGMFSRAPHGAAMLSRFHPFMTAQRLNGFQQDIKTVDAGIRDAKAAPPAVLAKAPSYGDLQAQWPAIDRKMTDLLNSVQANRPNYEAMAALPSFRLFPWFFVVPGLAVVGLSVLGARRPDRLRVARVLLVVVGLGLVAAPVAFDMFSRAPKGAHMMASFKTIETADNVAAIQSDFATMAAGQGDLRLTIVPALERTSSPQAVAARYPALVGLDQRWVPILNDMTPMIGAMSDSVADYQAISALPSFTLFPWFFVVPGLVVAGAALTARPRAAEAQR